MHTVRVPGRRLTHDDRRRIAAWLDDGLGYAEIARRLGRPTSTISREVARNGDPGAYLPDNAQQAAGQRSARRGPARTDEQATSEHTADFREEFASLLAATGMPRMPARVFACLLVDDAGSLTAAELVRRLRVSPASVSKAVGYLETMELIARGADPGSRRERYAVVDDVWQRAWQADTGAHVRVAEAARAGTEIVGAGTPAGDRLARMGEFFAWLSGQMSAENPADSDTLTLLAALAHAARPCTTDELAGALSWPRQRVAGALAALDRRPELGDPLTLINAGPGTYAVGTRPERLSPAQREALATRVPRCA
jgi:DNA-binding MarR family transcriptional regulator